LRSLTPEQLAELRRYGFDERLLQKWRDGLRAGTIHKGSNVVRGELIAPGKDQIAELPPRQSKEAEELRALGRAAIREGQLGIVVLNGGMATRFGGRVKGIVDVLGPSRSFLGLTMEDVRRAENRHWGRIPVFVMNSYATDTQTKAHFAEHQDFGLRPGQIRCFTQFVSVRLEKNGELHLDQDGKPSWYGPGHGDFAEAFRNSGLLRQFLAEGGRYLFVSNVDNLGARISALMLGMHIAGGSRPNARAPEVTVEVAPKWPGDVGGSPFVVEGRLQLIEQIRYPPGFDPEIVDVFNTNTFTFTASALERDFDLNYYYVEKKVDGRTVVQMERLIGELTRWLEPMFVKVKRTGKENRFFPIKTQDDLEAGKLDIEEMYPKE
jgi:UTP--glucose-1-phosphate uridylyltransferase